MSARRTERLLNLVFVLTNSQRALPKSRLRELLYQESASAEAFERMFERDKEELRGMGVPIETVSLDPLADDDLGYRLAKNWQLPDISFDVSELAVLAVAAAAWNDGCLAPAATTALRKLETAGDRSSDSGLPVVPRVATADPAFAAILAAINNRRELHFDYRRADADVSSRRLHPFGLVQRHGRWYLVGLDLDKGEDRVFRLSRMVGEPRAIGVAGVFTTSPAVQLERFAEDLNAEPHSEIATLLVAPQLCQELRRKAVAIRVGKAGDEIDVGYRDVRSFSASLASFGGAVTVMAPAALRDAVVARLVAVGAGTEPT